jgi:phosphoribosyl-ATP pyrophosphohydrolase/phosphoribosyl-AMP cyclohydrolase
MVKFNADGLIPAVTQDIRTDEVLMLAYMNEESLRKTIETGRVHYYSRSRQKLWLKGETSGHFQQVRSISLDCDGDTLLIKVDQTGAACHTGHRSCFFTKLDLEALKAGTEQESAEGADARAAQGLQSAEGMNAKAAQGPQSEEDTDGMQGAGTAQGTAQAADAVATGAGVGAAAEAGSAAVPLAGAEVLQEVFDVISDRQTHPKEGSYTNYLFQKGLNKILKKVGEEACEVVIASKNGDKTEIRSEIADLMYHLMVLLVERGMTLEDVYRELKQRE